MESTTQPRYPGYWIRMGLLMILILISAAIILGAISRNSILIFHWFGLIFLFCLILWLFSVIFGRRWHSRTYLGRYWKDSKEILKSRYASGELSKKQYLEMLKDLDK